MVEERGTIIDDFSEIVVGKVDIVEEGETINDDFSEIIVGEVDKIEEGKELICWLVSFKSKPVTFIWYVHSSGIWK